MRHDHPAFCHLLTNGRNGRQRVTGLVFALHEFTTFDYATGHYPDVVTGLDWVIVGFAVLLAFYGYVQGFIVGALSLVGFAVGAFLGTRLAPLLLSQGHRSPYAPLFGAARGAARRRRCSPAAWRAWRRRARSALRIPGCGRSTGCSARR